MSVVCRGLSQVGVVYHSYVECTVCVYVVVVRCDDWRYQDKAKGHLTSKFSLRLEVLKYDILVVRNHTIGSVTL